MFFRQKTGSRTDIELLQAFRASPDLSVVSELFGRYTALIYGVCLKYLKDRDDAKDAVMQIFEKLPASLQAHEITNFKSWVYVTARNHCLMQMRSKKKTDLVENQILLHPEEDPDLEKDLSKMERCIQKLDSEQQQCVRLFYLEEKCYNDITTLTGFDYNKVKSYIQNGKRNLKICMEKNE